MARRSKSALEDRFFSGERVEITQTDVERFYCPPDKDQHFLWDSKVLGFALRSSNKGTKSFVVKRELYVDGKQKPYKLNLGSVDVIGLESARQLAQEKIRFYATQQMTPSEFRAFELKKAIEEEQAKALQVQQSQLLTQEKEQYSLAQLCEKYADYLEEGGKVSHKGVRNALRLHVVNAQPEISSKYANDVTREDINTIIGSMIGKGIKTVSVRLRSYLVAAYSLGCDAQTDVIAAHLMSGFKIDRNPAKEVSSRRIRALSVPGERYLNQQELKLFLRALRGMQEGLPKDFIYLNLLLGQQRMDQLLRVQCSDLDLSARVITLRDGKGNRKHPRLHLVPLVEEAFHLLSRLNLAARDKKTNYLFESEVKPGALLGSEVISNHTRELVQKLLQKGDLQSSFTQRDLRRTVETILASEKISGDVRAQLQSHGLSGVQIRHYDRHDYLQEKRHALEVWRKVLIECGL